MRKETKFCTKCKEELPLSDFYVRKSGVKKGQVRNPCKVCENSATKRWMSENKEYHLARYAAYKKENRDIYNFYERNRKFLLRNPHLFGGHTFTEWEELKNKYGNMCLCCKKIEPEIRLTEDHIVPVSRGGLNTIDNIQPLCIQCNQIKNNKTISYVQDF